MRLDTNVITDQEEFHKMKEDWNALLSKNRTNTIFLTWEWLYTWWEVFGGNNRLFIVSVRNGRGDLVGLAPLFVRKASYYSMPVREMCFIGTGLSDRQDFLIAAGDSLILNEIVVAIRQHEAEWDIVQLEQIPGESLLAASSFESNLRAEREDSSLCPYVKVQGDWVPYYKGLGQKFHRDMKHKQNRLTKFGPWEFRTELSPDADIEKLVEKLADIEKQSRKHDVKPFFSIRNNREFLVKFIRACIAKEWFDLLIMTIDDVPVAYLIGFRYNAKYYAYNMAFAEQYRAASPGKLLLNEKLKRCFDSSGAVKEFDFLRGGTYIKFLWASSSRQHKRLVFFDNSFYAGILRYAVFRVRPVLKKLRRKQQGQTKLLISPIGINREKL